MSPARFRLYAAAVRAELLARGTPVEDLGPDEMTVRRQVGIWIPLLRLQDPTVVRADAVLVIPVVEKEA